MALCARKNGGANASRVHKDKRKCLDDFMPAQTHRSDEITYRLPAYTYTQKLEDYAHFKDPGRIATAMWRDYVDNSGQSGAKLNRPLRHYPAHHYRREIGQKIGLQRKEARLRNVLRASTMASAKNDVKALNYTHQPVVLDALKHYEVWRNLSLARQTSQQ
ncbi:hypothetical protein, conserved [Babesia bigemina]|uniref:Uncharacterized protein n=1 Tax=Babesia bigemina TaxID=5866 RepID=A0A061DCX0_BABBI|nr:hypothetical protein, conserved [Babesia bigemina]CDR98057.1 hypothetical protein, conserved [Babesia bigemina]|eukprot:XP_012770243.1 hypothetical protein, conserved [Babesia bigemina]